MYVCMYVCIYVHVCTLEKLYKSNFIVLRILGYQAMHEHVHTQ